MKLFESKLQLTETKAIKVGDQVEVKSFTGRPTKGTVKKQIGTKDRWHVVFEGGGDGNYDGSEIKKLTEAAIPKSRLRTLETAIDDAYTAMVMIKNPKSVQGDIKHMVNQENKNKKIIEKFGTEFGEAGIIESIDGDSMAKLREFSKKNHMYTGNGAPLNFWDK